MKLTNRQMDEYCYILRQVSPKTTGKLAFIIAKNIRLLSQELIEYQKYKDNAIMTYGVQGENGAYSINVNSSEFKKYIEEMKQYDDIEADVPIIMADPEDVYNQESLKGDDMLQILFMVND